MSNKVNNITNINLLTQAQYNSLDELSENELYAIEGSFVTFYKTYATGWLRKWSDGLIEYKATKKMNVTEVTFPEDIGFTSANYMVTLTPMAQTSNIPYFTNPTTTGFTTITDPLCFEVKGY